MPYRRSLGGGSRDVNPQFLSFSTVMSAANTVTSEQVVTPIYRAGSTSGGRATVMEVLKVYFQIGWSEPIAATGESSDTCEVYLTTRDFDTTQVTWSEPTCFAGMQQKRFGAFTAGGTYSQIYDSHVTQDLTDGTGHGILIATDRIYCQVSTANAAAARTCYVKVMYRMKEIGLAEYVGIVQSQTTGA